MNLKYFLSYFFFQNNAHQNTNIFENQLFHELKNN